jgi:hypothetical protein
MMHSGINKPLKNWQTKKAQSTVADDKVDCVGPQSGRGATANRGQPRGGRGQYIGKLNQRNHVSNQNANNYQSITSQRGRGHPRGGKGKVTELQKDMPSY